MKATARPMLTDTDQRLLDGVQVRLLLPEERDRFDQLLLAQHYLKSAALVGEQLRYVAEFAGQWVALLPWSAGTYHLKASETWIGWSAPQKKRRLALVANNSRFLILAGWHVPNLASRVMKLGLQRLSQDWQDRYHHPVLVAESFVDPQQFSGTCYQASGWTLLGLTQGNHRARQDFYLPHDCPKQLWVCELQPGARTLLRGRNQPEALRAVPATQPPECLETPAKLQEMTQFFADLTDWRKRKPDFSLASLVAVSLCAMLCGVCLGQRDLAAFAADLTVDQMEALRFPRDWTSRHHRYRPPGESSFFPVQGEEDTALDPVQFSVWDEETSPSPRVSEKGSSTRKVLPGFAAGTLICPAFPSKYSSQPLRWERLYRTATPFSDRV